MRKPDQRVAKIMACGHVDGAKRERTAADRLEFRRHHDRGSETGADAGHADDRPVKQRQVQTIQLVANGGIGVGKRFGLACNGGTIAHGYFLSCYDSAGVERGLPSAGTIKPAAR